MQHWNKKQYVAVWHAEKGTALVALDSNFDMRKDVAPAYVESYSAFQAWLKTLGFEKDTNGFQALTVPLVGQEWLYGTDPCFDDPIDVRQLARFLNDHAGMHAERVPFSKTHLEYIASTLDIEAPKGYWKECLLIAQIYKKLTQKGLL